VSIPWLFLAVSLVGAWFTVNALRPMVRGARRSVLSFFAGWLTSELALHHVAWQALFAAGFVWAGALGAWPGWVGLGVTVVSWAGLAWCFLGARSAEGVVERALCASLGDDYRDAIPADVREAFAPTVDWRELVVPLALGHPDVARVRDVTYAHAGGRPLKLDVYHPRVKKAGAPMLLQIHGGAWIVGSKNEQGVPLMLHLAAHGWVCVSANYRLSPRATFPDHLIDCKQALAWMREHAAEYGGDPDFIVVTGGSAGGHLASLVALTANAPEYQPGFEGADTSVAACVAFYGVYDFTDRDAIWPHHGLRRLLERRVMKQPFATSREAYDKASPMSCVHAEAPPFFVIHGDRDTMVPVEEARRFATLLRRTTGAPVVYAEIPGAQHAFEILPSLRSMFVIHGVERFLAWVYARHLAQCDAGGAAVSGRG
jgi:acetyl esterase/lipase